MKKKKYNIKESFNELLNDINTKYIDLIRGGNPTSFTRDRKVNPVLVFLQMFANKGKSLKNELLNFYEDMALPKNVSPWGFTKQRCKFNPEAIKAISYDYVKNYYENSCRDIKLNGYYVLAIDGSDIIVPSTVENKQIFGISGGKGNNLPAMAKTSVIYDCLNKVILDVQLDTYKFSEKKSAVAHLNTIRNILEDKKRVIVFDRGYPSIRLILDLIDHNDKFLFRLKSSDFKRERQSLKFDDEWIEIKYDLKRTNQYRTDFDLVERLLKLNDFKLRIVKVPITTPDGEIVDEYLLTNLNESEFDRNALKELYHLRWNVETSYRTLKSSMKLEEFSGLKPQIITQDVYISVFVFNLIQDLIGYTERVRPIQVEKYKHKMKINVNFAIGIVKLSFIKMLFEKSVRKSNKVFKQMIENISKQIVPIRNDRSYPRDIHPVNKSRMSYKYSY